MGGASKLLMVLPTRFPHPRAALRFAPRYLVPVPALSSSVSFRQCRYFLPFLPRLVRQGFFYIPSMQVHTNSTCAWEGYVDAMTSTAPDLNASVHPWPEWSKLVDLLVSLGYYDSQASATVPMDDDDSFSAREDLTDEFARAAQACLSFARDRPDFLRMLAKNDIEIITENSSPFLFRNGANSVRRLKAFVNADATNVLESESAQTVDIMRYLLSNACVSTSNHNQSITSRNLIEASTRRLFAELVRLNNVSSDLKSPGLNPGQTSTNHGQFLSPGGQNIEMKRGDWICPKCSFMNFARNLKCLECGETRPKRVVAGGEWECPQCDFFNYSRNMSCLRCDCKRPGESPINAAPSDAYGKSLNIGQILNGSGLDKSEIEKKLAANDEKAERWFSKISQLGDSADLSNAVDDEDFPEIMPMRKGVNRFVVSTRKTPLERRLANAQNKFNLADSSSSDARESQPGKASEISQMLDRILGRSSNSAGMNHPVANGGNNSELGNKFDSSDSRQGIANGKTDPYNVPPVSSPAGMSNTNNERSSYLEDSSLIKTSQLSDPVLKDFESTTESKDTSSFDASKRWSKEATELDTNKDVTKSISDDDFPEIMPMRRGENRFVVSNKKERTIISPQYKRRIAMEQANGSNFVPFVPFPPDYFAKKEHKQSEASPAGISSSEGRLHSTDQSSGVSATQSAANWSSNQNTSENSNTGSYMTHLDNHNMGAFSNGTPTTSPQLPSHTQNNQSQTWSNRSQSNTRSDPTVSANSHQTENSRSVNEGWKPRFSGKSLEGSAVTEPDPLDMSEEAKAARWFRRAAQIKDISELSNIPDEDFPEIMPMRKGVNRFVVSKRKTPLERRLTSPQYRRNLPIISSDPEKDSN